MNPADNPLCASYWKTSDSCRIQIKWDSKEDVEGNKGFNEFGLDWRVSFDIMKGN